jgi:hypothetical protein
MNDPKTAKTDDFAIDPRRFQGEAEAPFLKGSYQVEREQLVAHVIRDLRAFPPTDRNSKTGAVVATLLTVYPAWERIRALAVRADGVTVEEVLSRNGDQPLFTLLWLMNWLLAARARHAEMLKQIEQTEVIAAALGEPVADALRNRATSDHRRLDTMAAPEARMNPWELGHVKPEVTDSVRSPVAEVADALRTEFGAEDDDRRRRAAEFAQLEQDTEAPPEPEDLAEDLAAAVDAVRESNDDDHAAAADVFRELVDVLSLDLEQERRLRQWAANRRC